MPSPPLRVLISGASVAGPTAAYWLCRQGFAVTVVERMPLARVRTSGHAVDLFGPAMDVAEWTGVLPAVTDARTRTEIVSFQRQTGRGADVEMRRLVAGISGRHAGPSIPPRPWTRRTPRRTPPSAIWNGVLATSGDGPSGWTTTGSR